MNAFQTCQNTSDAVPLYLPQQLYLKPIARMNISVQLPARTMGKTVSFWEAMDQLRNAIRPEKFVALKTSKTSTSIVRFIGEIDDKSKLDRVVNRLNGKLIKLKDFPELLKVKAAIAKLNFPARHDWDLFFHEAKHMNEMKPGERPDTIYISNLPIKWFVSPHLLRDDDLKPSEKIFYRTFEKFGQIRYVDIPICDPYRKKMKAEVAGMQTFSFEEEHFFEGYVQFKDYVGFTRAMDALKGMKLLHKEDSEIYTVNINVDFDRTKHLSEGSMRRREIVRDHLVKKELEKESKEKQKKEDEDNKLLAERQKELDKKKEKERRRREREEKRKSKILSKLKVTGTDELNDKIAREEKKLLKVQRKLEAIRLVEELFKRIKNTKESDLKVCGNAASGDELTQLKNLSEFEVRQQKQKLHEVIQGRIVLRNLLSSNLEKLSDSSSSDESSKAPQRSKGRKVKSPIEMHDGHYPMAEWYGPSAVVPPLYAYVPPMARGQPFPNFSYRGRGRGLSSLPGPSRGYPRRGRGRYRPNYTTKYPPELEHQYYRYFEKFLHEHDDRSRSYTRSRSRSRRRRTRSRSRSYRKSRSRSRSSRSRSRRRTRSKSRSRSSRRRSRTRSKSRSKSRDRSKTKQSKKQDKEKSRSRSVSYKSIDSSKFISPSRLKSWTPARKSDRKNSWSRSPTPPPAKT